MKLGVFIQTQIQKGKGWEEKKAFYLSNSVESHRRGSQNPLRDKNHKVMFQVLSGL